MAPQGRLNAFDGNGRCSFVSPYQTPCTYSAPRSGAPLYAGSRHPGRSGPTSAYDPTPRHLSLTPLGGGQAQTMPAEYYQTGHHRYPGDPLAGTATGLKWKPSHQFHMHSPSPHPSAATAMPNDVAKETPAVSFLGQMHNTSREATPAHHLFQSHGSSSY